MGAALTNAGKSPPLRRVFSPFLLSLVAIDDEHGMSFVTEGDARDWGVEWADVLSAALANLLDTAVPVGAPLDSPWLDVLGPDGYVSSWLVAPQALEQFAESLGSDFVAVAKSRDALRLIAISDRDFLVTELERLLGEYMSEPRQLSPVPFVIQNGEIAPWDPPENDLCRPIVDRLQHMLALREYDLQLTDTKADLWVRWEDAERGIGGALQEEREYYPPRWRARGWPEDRVVAELGKLAVNPVSDRRTQ